MNQNNIFFIDSSGKAWTEEEWKKARLVYQNFRENKCSKCGYDCPVGNTICPACWLEEKEN